LGEREGAREKGRERRGEREGARELVVVVVLFWLMERIGPARTRILPS